MVIEEQRGEIECSERVRGPGVMTTDDCYNWVTSDTHTTWSTITTHKVHTVRRHRLAPAPTDCRKFSGWGDHLPSTPFTLVIFRFTAFIVQFSRLKSNCVIRTNNSTFIHVLLFHGWWSEVRLGLRDPAKGAVVGGKHPSQSLPLAKAPSASGPWFSAPRYPAPVW